MDVKEQILSLMRKIGPVLPFQVAKEIQSNILMASAHLSELSSKKLVKVSHLKVGGSPLYYLSGQEAMLQQYSGNLAEKEQRAYNLLKQKKILRDNKLEPLYRVAMRQIRDFAVPLEVNHKGVGEIFWKWYLVLADEAEKLIKQELNVGEAEQKKEEKQKEQIKQPEQKVSEPKKTEQKTLSPDEPKQKEPEKPKGEKAEASAKQDDSFYKKVSSYFEKNRINVVEQNILRKNNEVDFIIKVPSPVGHLLYYCKARNKKSVNDGDLSSAYIQSQSRKLPVMFLTTGKLTKRAKEMLENEFKGMNILYI